VSKIGNSASFIERHRSSKSAFTRDRKLPFNKVLQLLICKSVKSIQLVLNEWSERLGGCVSASAYSQARHKVRHTAFIELLEKAVIDVMYGDGDYKKFKGHRLLALDGSSLRLPNTPETRERFGFIEHMNGLGAARGGQVEAKMTVLYDVLNRIPISAVLDKGRTNDLKASEVHLPKLKKGDVILADRAYGSYRFFAQILGQNADFIIRCKEKTFDRYHKLFSDKTKNDVIVELEIPYAIATDNSIPKTIKVRFLRVVLAGGEIEILATSFINRRRYSSSDFGRLYNLRWGVETFFQTLKSRLCIDNFTGKSVEAIYQDFYSTLFVSGLETIITSEANDELQEKDVRLEQKVNKAVSFHTIKNTVISLIFEQPLGFEDQIKNLLILNPTLLRPDRLKQPRPDSHAGDNRRSLYFQRYAKKHVY